MVSGPHKAILVVENDKSPDMNILIGVIRGRWNMSNVNISTSISIQFEDDEKFVL